MGLYIPGPPKGKADYLLAEKGAVWAKSPVAFQPDLVCVVDNETWDAAAYCDSPEEFRRFMSDPSGRHKEWLIVPHAKELAR